MCFLLYSLKEKRVLIKWKYEISGEVKMANVTDFFGLCRKLNREEKKKGRDFIENYRKEQIKINLYIKKQ